MSSINDVTVSNIPDVLNFKIVIPFIISFIISSGTIAEYGETENAAGIATSAADVRTEESEAGRAETKAVGRGKDTTGLRETAVIHPESARQRECDNWYDHIGRTKSDRA